MDPRTTADNPTFVTSLEEEERLGTSAPIPKPAAQDRRGDSLLHDVLSATVHVRGQEPSLPRLNQFLQEASVPRALCLWLGLADPSATRPDRAEITRRLSRDIARIDDLLNQQLNAILHHPIVPEPGSLMAGTLLPGQEAAG